MLRPSRKIKRRIFATLSINITCSFSALKYADVNKTGGSILNANYPPKWVNFACLFTGKVKIGADGVHRLYLRETCASDGTIEEMMCEPYNGVIEEIVFMEGMSHAR